MSRPIFVGRDNYHFNFDKVHLEMSSAKCHTFFLATNVLTDSLLLRVFDVRKRSSKYDLGKKRNIIANMILNKSFKPIPIILNIRRPGSLYIQYIVSNHDIQKLFWGTHRSTAPINTTGIRLRQGLIDWGGNEPIHRPLTSITGVPL